jgi:hypothetical protein
MPRSTPMPGKVRSIDRGYIRLSEPARTQVEYLARLAGVGTAEIVNFVLSEMLELDDAAAPAPPVRRRGPAVQARPRGPADVIPIGRKRAAVLPCVPLIDLRDIPHRRCLAAEIRCRAREVRGRATRARAAALGARTRAGDLLDRARSDR